MKKKRFHLVVFCIQQMAIKENGDRSFSFSLDQTVHWIIQNHSLEAAQIWDKLEKWVLLHTVWVLKCFIRKIIYGSKYRQQSIRNSNEAHNIFVL